MQVPSAAHANDYLLKTHYYRFTGYSRLWQINPSLPAFDKTTNKSFYDSYHPSANFEFICEIIALDAQVRSLLFESLSKIELALRSLFAYKISKFYEDKNGAGNQNFYLDASHYSGEIKIPKNASPQKIFEISEHNKKCPDEIEKLIAGIRRDLDQAYSSPSSVRHYATYGEIENDYTNLPIWVAVEHISFGKLSKMISYTKEQEVVKEIANKCGILYADFHETLRGLAVLRNACAHHKQLWNVMSVVTIPKSKRAATKHSRRPCSDKSFYTAVFTMNHLLRNLGLPHEGMEKVERLLSNNYIYSEFFTHPVGLKKTIWENFRCHHADSSCQREGRCKCYSLYSKPRPDLYSQMDGCCGQAKKFFPIDEMTY